MGWRLQERSIISQELTLTSNEPSQNGHNPEPFRIMTNGEREGRYLLRRARSLEILDIVGLH
jgi:hypothetical protein